MEQPQYKVLETGQYRIRMPELRAEGMKPATMAQIARGRLDDALSFDTYYDTSSGIAYAPNSEDRFRVLAYSQELADVTPATELSSGGIRLSPEQYTALQSPELARKEIVTGRRLTQKEAESHLGWLALFGQDKDLLGEYTERAFKEVKDRHKEKEAMGFYIRDSQEVSSLRPVYFDNLSYRSGASDNCDIDGNRARLVGVVSGKSAEGATQKF